ncbi:DUF2946 domain-containing protein [Paraburkholderia sp. Tr-20389]|uniref:DUF2946 domain-containing protein n=1 Tax=Paraburkholderia sp. Tr-20389 TaxID=2703903 RepID=UPI00197EA5DD|nr:DUF2946 domain-containing protein [Paraburkholderia sp. Tr-20389]MBN3757626.1 DUF2946 domain-containing protein [Paraburkholderia sp. Tr-20389]
MSSQFHRKIGSIIGLLAILMATLAPTVSQAIAAKRGAYDPAAALCSAQTASPADAQEDNPTDTHTLASHWHACGYCSLLTHVPVLPASPSAFALTVTVISQRVATRFESVALIAPFEAAQPRAPPISL